MESGLENSEEDETFIEIAPFTRRALHYYFMWPEKFTKKYLFGLTIYLICSFFLIYGSIGHFIHNTANHGFDFAIVADDMTIILTCLTFLYLIIVSLPIRKDFSYFFKVMGDFSHYQKPRTIVAVNALMDRIGKYVFYYIWFSIGAMMILKGCEKCEPDDYSDCGFLMVSYLPFDIYSSPNRKIYMVLQVTSIKIIGSVSHLNGWLFSVAVECIICYIQELIIMVQEIPQIRDKKTRRKHLIKCIEYHQNILDHTDTLFGKASCIAYVHLYATPIIMSLIAFQLLAVEFDIKNVIHFSIWLVITVADCIISERLIHECDNLYTAIYNSIPFDDDVHLSKDMMLMMLRAERALTLAGFGVGNLGHEHLMKIFTKAYSYLTVLASTL